MGRRVLIRQYQPGDEAECKRIVHRGTMSTVRPAFLATLTREVSIHVVVLTAAVMFVFLSLSPSTCLLALPTTALVVYAAIYLAHIVKADAFSKDMLNISENYMASGYSGFWVAEMYEPEGGRDLGPVVIQSSLNWTPLEGKYAKRLVGTAALVRSNNDPSSARMRRVVVEPEWQRHGIASALIDEVVKFARFKGYTAIELVTTEFHESARLLYMKRGFELRQLYHNQIFLNIVQILMFEFVYKLDVGNYIA